MGHSRIPGSQVGYLLGHVSVGEWIEDRPLLSAIVISAQEGNPGKGFYDLAASSANCQHAPGTQSSSTGRQSFDAATSTGQDNDQGGAEDRSRRVRQGEACTSRARS
jgi:hypothetical protein